MVLTSDQDKDTFRENVAALSQDTPYSSVAAEKIRRVVDKVTGPAKDTLRDLVVQVASETIKKILWGH